MISRGPFTDKLLQVVAEATSKPVGDATIPAVGTELAAPPYYVQYPMPAVYSGAPLTDLNEDASFVYQWTCVSGPVPGDSKTRGARSQSEWLVDKLRQTLLGRDPGTGAWLHDLNIPGAKVYCRELDSEAGATNDPGDAIISYVIRVRFDLTPA